MPSIEADVVLSSAWFSLPAGLSELVILCVSGNSCRRTSPSGRTRWWEARGCPPTCTRCSEQSQSWCATSCQDWAQNEGKATCSGAETTTQQLALSSNSLAVSRRTFSPGQPRALGMLYAVVAGILTTEALQETDKQSFHSIYSRLVPGIKQI